MAGPEHHHEEPIESVVVGDKRNTLGRRLGLLAIALLLLFFAISSYIQSAQNGRQLNRAAADRSKLIHSISDLTNSNRQQSRFIRQLQKAIRDQNALLRTAGFHTVRVPTFNSGSPQPSPQPNSSPSSRSSPAPSRSPSPKPTPTPNPTDMVKDEVCRLTGICEMEFPRFIIF